MSNHKTPLTEVEREGLIEHGLGRYIGKPSQLADVFRQGVAWALKAAPATAPAWHDAPTEVKQIAEALRQIGLTLVRTGDGYKVLKLGAITAQEDKP